MYLRADNVMANLVTVFNDLQGLTPRVGSEYGAGNFRAIAETDDVVATQFTRTAGQTLTPGIYADQFFITDAGVESNPDGLLADAAEELGGGAAKKIETSLLGTFSSLTGGTVGAAGSTISWGYFYAMRSQLEAAKAKPPYIFVCHTYQWHILAKAASVAGSVVNAPEFQDDIMKRWNIMKAGDVFIYSTPDITVDSSDDAYCAMFSRQALGLDYRRGFRLMPERDESRGGGGVELNANLIFGYGVWRPALGIQGIFDAATPTS